MGELLQQSVQGDNQRNCMLRLSGRTLLRHLQPILQNSSVFESREKAQKFAEYQEENPDDVFPKCMGCHYNAFKED